MRSEAEKKPLILIVDDIPRNLQVLSNVLHAEQYQISFASNGVQALSAVEANLPDLVLLDIMMPEMDGFEVCERLKSDPKTSGVPVIFLTGKAETEDIANGFKLGAVDYVTKPFNSTELLSRVKTHLDLKFSKDAILSYSKQLEEYQEELKQVIASKDKFFSIVAHDLRGPFTGFLGLSELLAEEYQNLEKEEISQMAGSMNKAAKRLFEFLENLLEWSRVQMGKMEYNPTKIEVAEMFERVLALMHETAKAKDISLEISLKEPIAIKADNYMLNTIIRNLVTNALKFTNKGGKVILEALDAGDGTALIKVIDNGVGMSEEVQKKIFRIDSKHSTPGTANESGSGLGLVLCKELVEKNLGTISVESQSGVGSVFTVKLPLYNENN